MIAYFLRRLSTVPQDWAAGTWYLPLWPPEPKVVFKAKCACPTEADYAQENQAIEPGPFSFASATPLNVPLSSLHQDPQGHTLGTQKPLLSLFTTAPSSNKWHQASESCNHLRRTQGQGPRVISLQLFPQVAP